jgi:hypothetical protein
MNRPPTITASPASITARSSDAETHATAATSRIVNSSAAVVLEDMTGSKRIRAKDLPQASFGLSPNFGRNGRTLRPRAPAGLSSR